MQDLSTTQIFLLLFSVTNQMKSGVLLFREAPLPFFPILHGYRLMSNETKAGARSLGETLRLVGLAFLGGIGVGALMCKQQALG